jgi:hypothetical protein
MKTILAILLIIAIFIGSKKLVCTPDYKVAEVSLPLAKVIVEHIEEKGVPEYLNDIEGLPYELKGCKKRVYKENMPEEIAIEYIETCYFRNQEKSYIIKFEQHTNNRSTYNNIYIYIKQHLTECGYSIRYDKIKEKWIYERYPKPNMWLKSHNWICNPKLFRITD